MCHLSVRLVSEAMLFNSVTVRLGGITKEQFLSPLYDQFVNGLAAIIPCAKENVFIFSIQVWGPSFTNTFNAALPTPMSLSHSSVTLI